MQRPSVVIIGGGPAGLAAAYELARNGIRPIVLEQADKVGGLARTEMHNGYRFDIGGHRFYTKVDTIQRLWEEMLGEEFRVVQRLSRIHYRGKFFRYPLELSDTLRKLGVVESALILLSYLRARLRRPPPESTFEEWVTNRFGHRLYDLFFRTYTEKVWGIPGNQIQAEWAAQRIKGLSVRAAISSALWGNHSAKSLIREFHYPVLGPGMMWQRFQEAVETLGGEVWLRTEAVRLERDHERVTAVWAKREGQSHALRLEADSVISSMSLPDLAARLDPLPPEEIVRAAGGLNWRDFILVGLVVDRADLFPDNWIYVHSPEVQVGRIQNFGNWSGAMVPAAGSSSLGMEYFCNEGDDLWTMPDSELVGLATREFAALGLADGGDVQDGVVFRQRQAYPVYDPEFRDHLGIVRGFLATARNLQTVGRRGTHRYNNMDHSMLMGMLAARNIMGESHNLWDVNTDGAYGEEAMTG